jgi:hypothetical protein
MPCTICQGERTTHCGACYQWLRQAAAQALDESEKYREQLTALQTTFRRPRPASPSERDVPQWQRDLSEAMAAIIEPALSGRHAGECGQEAGCCDQCYGLLHASLERALRACRNREAASADDILQQFVEEETARRQGAEHPPSSEPRPGRYYRSHFADDL